MRSPRVIIMGLMRKGAAPETPGVARTVAMTSRYSVKSHPYLSTSTCALTPSTLSRNASWKPEVIASTAESAHTPRAMPTIAMIPMTEMKVLRRARRWRSATTNAKFTGRV